jgi:hypothetical protein
MRRSGWAFIVVALWVRPAWAAFEVSLLFLVMYRKTRAIETERTPGGKEHTEVHVR